MLVGFPCLQKKQKVGILLGEEIILTVATVLGKNRIKDALFPNPFHEGFPLAGITVKGNVNGIHGFLLFSFIITQSAHSVNRRTEKKKQKTRKKCVDETESD
jgi:hypothetical protein